MRPAGNWKIPSDRKKENPINGLHDPSREKKYREESASLLLSGIKNGSREKERENLYRSG